MAGVVSVQEKAGQTRQTAFGKWYFDIPEAGNYEVLVSIPRITSSKSLTARYEISHNGETHFKIVDQSSINSMSIEERWVSLGVYMFRQGSGQYITLSNSTGEANLKVVYDALKLLRR